MTGRGAAQQVRHGRDGAGGPAPDGRRRRAPLGTRRALGVVAALALAAGVVFPAVARAEDVTTNRTGTSNGFWYSFWTDRPGSVSMGLGPGGGYTTSWQGTGNFVAGKGWATGSRRTVSYSGTFSPSGNAYLALYGWTRDPLVEYYVVDSWGTYRPTGTFKGTVTTDGGTYDLYQTQRVQQPSIIGTATFTQLWSVRQTRRVGGTITVGNHFDAWAKAGMRLGSTFDYMILATEGYQSSGSSSVVVSDVAAPAPAPTTTTTPAPVPTTTRPTTPPTSPPATTTSTSTSTATTTPACTARLSAGRAWPDRFNLRVDVTGSSAWTVRLRLRPGQSLQNSWNAAVTSSGRTVTARPDGHGSSFGITVMSGGSTAWPAVSCR